MNGIVAQSMREKGMAYKINFGLTLPLLKSIAESLPKEKDLAVALWNDKAVRESMLLAPMVCPPEEITAEEADRWIEDASYCEVADFCCKYLFCRMHDAARLASEWIGSENKMKRYAGYQLLSALLIDKSEIPAEYHANIIIKSLNEWYSQTIIYTASAASGFIKRALQNKSWAEEIQAETAAWCHSEDERRRKIASEIADEYELCRTLFP